MYYITMRKLQVGLPKRAVRDRYHSIARCPKILPVPQLRGRSSFCFFPMRKSVRTSSVPPAESGWQHGSSNTVHSCCCHWHHGTTHIRSDGNNTWANQAAEISVGKGLRTGIPLKNWFLLSLTFLQMVILSRVKKKKISYILLDYSKLDIG